MGATGGQTAVDPRRLAIATLCVGALFAILAALVGDFEDTSLRIGASAGVAVVYIVVGLPGLLAFGRRETSAFGALALIAAAVALALAIAAIWAEDRFGNDDVQTWAQATVVALAMSLACILLRRARADDDEAASLALRLTLAVDAVVAVWGVLLIGADDPADGSYRGLAAALVLLVLGSLTVPLLRRSPGEAAPVSAPVPAAGADLLARSLGLGNEFRGAGGAYVVHEAWVAPLVDRARGLGAQVLVAPHVGGGGRRIAVLADHEGNSLTLVSPPGP